MQTLDKQHRHRRRHREQGRTRRDKTRHNQTRQVTTQHDMARHDKTKTKTKTRKDKDKDKDKRPLRRIGSFHEKNCVVASYTGECREQETETLGRVTLGCKGRVRARRRGRGGGGVRNRAS